MSNTENPRAAIGGNNPPPDSALDAWKAHADDLSQLAEGLTAITDEAQAASVGEVLSDAKKALSSVAKAITAERKPHRDAADAISDSYKPVVDTLERVKTATAALADAWLQEQRRKEAEAADAARKVAQEAEEVARRKAAEADQTDVAALAEADAAQEVARRAATAAKVAGSRKTTVAGARWMTRRDVAVADRKALLIHVAQADPDALEAWLLGWAEKADRAGVRDIPGVTVTERKEAA